MTPSLPSTPTAPTAPILSISTYADGVSSVQVRCPHCLDTHRHTLGAAPSRYIGNLFRPGHFGGYRITDPASRVNTSHLSHGLQAGKAQVKVTSEVLLSRHDSPARLASTTH